MLGFMRNKGSGEPLARRMTWDDVLAQVKFLQHSYPLGLQMSMPSGPNEPISQTFEGFAEIYRKNGPVFSCIAARMALFSEARFQYQRFEKGRPGELAGSAKLRILERPWPNGDTGELLSRAEQDASLAGNWFVHQLDEERLRRLRPDWVTIVMGSRIGAKDIAKAIDAEVLAYAYEPPGEKRQWLLPETVVHWSPIPDPTANYRGMSWIPPALMDIQADTSSATHRNRFFENAATSNFVVLPDKDIGIEEFRDFRDDFTQNYEGALNAYKTIFMGGGSDVKVLGLDFEKMDFRNVQGAGETRIAAAAQVPPIIAGFSEGLQAATYSNYGQARRKFGDHFARPQWRSVANALAKFVDVPNGSRLWYDDRDIPFLREDLGDEAEIRAKDAATIKTLIDAGYTPDAAVNYVRTSNLGILIGGHSGRVSVQLNPMDANDSPADGADGTGTPSPPDAEGDGNSPDPAAANGGTSGGQGDSASQSAA